MATYWVSMRTDYHAGTPEASLPSHPVHRCPEFLFHSIRNEQWKRPHKVNLLTVLHIQWVLQLASVPAAGYANESHADHAIFCGTSHIFGGFTIPSPPLLTSFA